MSYNAPFNHGLVQYKDHHVINLEVPLLQSTCSAPPPERSQGAQPVDGRGAGRPAVLPRHLVRACTPGSSPGIGSRASVASRRAFAAQFAVPGLVAFRGQPTMVTPVGMVLWYCQGQVDTPPGCVLLSRGYLEKASYALFWTAVERFRGRLRWLSLGSGAGKQATRPMD